MLWCEPNDMHASLYTERVNSYFAVLILTIVASGATLLIVHVANASTFAFIGGNEVQYNSLKGSILQK